MLNTVAQELQEKTLAYWNLSRTFNDQNQANIETGEAIEVCSTILEMTNFTRPLSFATDRLLIDIIRGEESTYRQDSEVLPFRNRV